MENEQVNGRVRCWGSSLRFLDTRYSAHHDVAPHQQVQQVPFHPSSAQGFLGPPASLPRPLDRAPFPHPKNDNYIAFLCSELPHLSPRWLLVQSRFCAPSSCVRVFQTLSSLPLLALQGATCETLFRACPLYWIGREGKKKVCSLFFSL